jgi:hypothetical protein
VKEKDIYIYIYIYKERESERERERESRVFCSWLGSFAFGYWGVEGARETGEVAE